MNSMNVPKVTEENRTPTSVVARRRNASGWVDVHREPAGATWAQAKAQAKRFQSRLRSDQGVVWKDSTFPAAVSFGLAPGGVVHEVEIQSYFSGSSDWIDVPCS